MAEQIYNYELSEVRKLLEMNRQRGTRLLEGTYQSLFLSHSDDGELEMNEPLSKNKIFIIHQKLHLLHNTCSYRRKAYEKGIICLQSIEWSFYYRFLFYRDEVQ